MEEVFHSFLSDDGQMNHMLVWEYQRMPVDKRVSGQGFMWNEWLDLPFTLP